MAETPFGKLVVELGLNNVQFTKGLSDAQKQLRTLKRAIKASDEDIKLMGKGSQAASTKMQLLSQAFKTTGNVVEHTKIQLQIQEEQLRRLRDVIDATGTKTKEQTAAEKKHVAQIEKLKGKLVEATASMSMYRREYAETAKAQAIANNGFIKAGTRLEEAGKRMTESGNRILNVARGWTFASAILGTGIGLVAKQAIDYEKAIAGVRKTTDPTTAQLQEFSLGFRKMSTEIPVAAKELANMGQMAGQLGIRNDSLLTFVETMAKLQTATNIIGEEGAADLAKFMNIMGTSQDRVSNLGSTLVELGNHFATTERDILDMGKNLAGAGRQIGLSESAVLGIATALSSVGIEAEKGGSAFSKVMIKMALAVDSMDTSAGSKLSEFAGVAGMTAESFANMFKSHPEQAIAAFVEGLGTASEKGETAIGILQEMGIKEVRLRDTLLRAGGAYKLFNDAVNMGNKAFKENTALQHEFNIFNETTASKLERAKNKLTDLAIEAGGKLLPVIADFLGKSDYIINDIKGLIEGFSNLPEPMQKTAFALTAIGLAGGPVLGVIGQTANTIGLFTGGIGSVLKRMGLLQVKSQETKGEFDLVKGAIKTAGESAVEAGAGMASLGGEMATTGGFASKLMGLGLNPWLVGIAAAVGLGIVAWKAFGENMYNSAKSAERVKKWGTDVSDEIDSALRKAEEFGNNAQTFLNRGFKVDDSIKEEAKKQFSGMFDALKTTADKQIDEIEKSYNKLPEKVKGALAKEVEERKTQIGESKKVIEENEARINEIYDTASQERRRLTKEEVAEINQLRKEAYQEEANILSANAKDRKKIMENLTESLTKLDDNELQQRQAYLAKLGKTEKQTLNENLESLKELWQKGTISAQSYADQKLEIEKDHNVKMKEIALQRYQAFQEEIKRNDALGDEEASRRNQIIKAATEQVLKEYGFTVEEIEKLSREQEKNLNRTAQYISSTMEEMGHKLSDSTKKANIAWETLITDEKTGNIVKNIDEVLQKAISTEKGWNDLKFVIHNAKLTTNAKAQITQALQTAGKWNDLDLETKSFLTATNVGETMAHILQEKGKWDELTIEEKQAVLNYNGLNEGIVKIIEAKKLWENTDFVKKLAEIDTNAPDSQNKIDKLLESYGVLERRIQNPANVRTMTDADGTARQVDGLTQKVERNMFLSAQGSYFNTSTNAGAVSGTIEHYNDLVNSAYSKTVYFTIAYQETGTSALSTWERMMNSGRRYATGTEGHAGGLAFLGDGGRREPFLTPDGYFGVSPSTDTLYDLPRGTKVWSSIDKFKRDTVHKPYLAGYLDKLPRFYKGTLKSFIDNTNVRVPDVFKSRNTVDNSTYAPVLHIENFHANNNMDVEELFRQFKWMIKREGDRA